MDIEHIREFIKIAEKLNFSLVARELYVSQSTLTRHIQAMERELGMQLFSTSKHGTSLTEQGKSCLVSFRKIIKEYDNLILQQKNLSERISGKLVLGLLYYSLDECFSDFLPLFQKKYPEVELFIPSIQSPDISLGIANGKLDIGQFMTTRGLEISAFKYTRFYKTRYIAMISDLDPLAGNESVCLSELTGRTLVRLRDDQQANTCVDDLLYKNHVSFQKSVYEDNIEAAALKVQALDGVHITGESCMKQNNRHIRYMPLSDNNAYYYFYFGWLETNPNPLVKIFLDEAKDYFTKNRNF